MRPIYLHGTTIMTLSKEKMSCIHRAHFINYEFISKCEGNKKIVTIEFLVSY